MDGILEEAEKADTMLTKIGCENVHRWKPMTEKEQEECQNPATKSSHQRIMAMKVVANMKKANLFVFFVRKTSVVPQTMTLIGAAVAMQVIRPYGSTQVVVVSPDAQHSSLDFIMQFPDIVYLASINELKTYVQTLRRHNQLSLG